MEQEKISQMFSGVAHRYDFLNHLLSLGLDVLWRKKLARLANAKPQDKILDLATGTGDVAIEFIRQYQNISVVGVDFSEVMLEVARNKAAAKGLSNFVRFQYGDALALPFQNNQFDIAVMAFGIRNVADCKKGIDEMKRLAKVGGKVLILEFSKPSNLVLPLYRLYLNFFIPLLGAIFSKKEAYRYLSNSIWKFIKTVQVVKMMKNAGLANVRQIPMTFGVVSIYIGSKV